MYEEYYKEFLNDFNILSTKHSKYNVFVDLLKLASFSMYNVFVKSEEIEQKYLAITSQYSKEEIEIFCKMFGTIVQLYSAKGEVTDVLGDFYMKENIGSKNLGQFFTPFHISHFMAKCILDEENCRNVIKEKGYITLSEPCCGAGGMILATAKVLKEIGINYQQNLLVYAVDISEVCTYMTYIQLALYGIPAKVFCGNTITGEMNFCLKTPFYFMNYWKFRNSNKAQKKTENSEIEVDKEIISKFNEVTKNGVCQISLW